MAKHDLMSPKACDKRLKARARQKLKWYCHTCRKQCRDENGFKCHCTSESHLRLMALFGQNPAAFIDSYSAMFQEAFLEHLQRSHTSSRVSANAVYNDYIGDRHHLHMNATKWLTLTDFVKHLGRAGICKVEPTPKGWFIAYLGKRTEALLAESLQKKRRKVEIAYEDRLERDLLQQVETAAQQQKQTSHALPAHQHHHHQEGSVPKVAFTLRSGKQASRSAHLTKKPAVFQATETAPQDSEETPWISDGLVVKVMSKTLADTAYFKKKGVVQQVLRDNKHTAAIQMLDTGDMVDVDQADLETVIPQLGALVRIVNGAYRGSTAKLLSVDTASFSATVQVESGLHDGTVLAPIDYDDICKFL